MVLNLQVWENQRDDKDIEEPSKHKNNDIFEVPKEKAIEVEEHGQGILKVIVDVNSMEMHAGKTNIPSYRDLTKEKSFDTSQEVT